ncbi:MAG: hypothetical protein RR211_00575 [Pseudoflavonifractor sp.]
MIAIIIRPFTYESDIQISSGRNNPIKIENLTPVLTEEERIEQRRCIESGLFEVFIKYAENPEKINGYCGTAAV